MYKTLAVITLVALLTGCATPQEFMAEPPDAQLTLKLPPDQAVICMTRNMEAKGSGFISDRRPTSQGGWEIIVRGIDTLFAVGQLKPEGNGSHATVWMAALVFQTKESVIADMTKGC